MDDKKKQKILNQQAAEQAPPGGSINISFVTQSLEDIQKAKEIPVDELEKRREAEEKLLVELGQSEAWAVFKKRVQLMSGNLEQMLRQKVIASGDLKLEDVGLRYLVTDQIVNALKDVLNIVEYPVAIKKAQVSEEEKKEEGEKVGG